MTNSDCVEALADAIHGRDAIDTHATLTARCARLEAALQRLAGPAIHTDPTGPQSQSWTIMRLRTELADRRDIAREALR